MTSDIMATGLAIITTWVMTKATSIYKKRTPFAKFPSFGFAMIFGAFSIAGLYYTGIMKGLPIIEVIWRYIISVGTASGLHSGVNNIIEKAKGDSTGTDFSSDFSLNKTCSILIPIKNGSSVVDFIPLEYMLSPNYIVRSYAYKKFGDNIKSAKLLSKVAITLYQEYSSRISYSEFGVYNPPRLPQDILLIPEGTLSALEYTILEAVVIGTLIGHQRVRMVYSKVNLFNVMYIDGTWRETSALSIYNYDKADSIFSIYGAILGEKYTLNITGAKTIDKDFVDNMLIGGKKQ